MNFDIHYPGETEELDDTTRATTRGSFVELADGYTHYEFGPGDRGDPVVLVHGFSAPYLIWDPTFQALVGERFSVLRYDLYGRGYSDRPRTKYGLELFVRQLLELADRLGLGRINLVGLSMGGAISSAFTVRCPQRVASLTLIDPIGVEGMPLSWFYRIAMLPGISELILAAAGTEKLVKNIASDFFDPTHVEMFQNQYRIQMRFRGFKRAILSTLRNQTLGGFPEIYDELGRLKIPIQLIWGRNDQTIPIEQSRSILRAVPGAEFRIIENTGHIPHYEKPEIFNPILMQFLGAE